MKIRFIKPSYEIDMLGQTGIEKLKAIEQKGKICYKAEHNITEDSYIKFVKMIVDNKHHSVLEHESVSFKFICDRGVSHELVRHRTGIGYSQESTRYCTYNDTMEFIIPSWFNRDELEFEKYMDDCHEILDWAGENDSIAEWGYAMVAACDTYGKLLHNGWKAQQARSVLPNSLKTEIWSTCNLREMRHIFQLRISPAAHPDFRELSIPMLTEMKQLIPIVFDDI
jgi:thymidylate synthase (FAD)